MTSIRIQLDDATYERIRKRAEAEGRSVEEIAADVVSQHAPPPPLSGAAKGGVIGMWADDPDAVEEMLKTVMEMRRERNEALLRKVDDLAGELDRP